MTRNPLKTRLTYGRIAATAAATALMLAAAQAEAGSIFVTGHDSDEHNNSAYMAAGLDFLLFGQAGAPASTVDRATKSVAYISVNNSLPSGIANAGYTNVTSFSGAASLASLFSGSFDAIMVGSGSTSAIQANLAANETNFTNYFNAGGALYINTDEGFGQSWYDFVPEFGATQNNSISQSGVFQPTADGLDIGLTNAIVDADITHSYYTGVDTGIFTIFETTDPNFFGGNTHAVAFGASDITINEGGEFEGVPEPGVLAMFGLGLAGLGYARRRRSRG